MIRNGDFSDRNWRDMPPFGTLINQEPAGWHLEWIEPGQPLYDDANTLAGGVPECVHKLSTQLPPNEQLGGPQALILVGDATYKIFHANAPFGASLSQTISGLQRGSEGTLTVPILAVLHGETDAFGAESGVWVNGEGGWINGQDMGNRKWCRHKVTFTVPDDGRAEVVIRVKSKWPRPKDFFLDGITLEAVEATTDEPPPVEPPPVKPPTGVKAVRIRVPAGLRVVRGTSHEPDIVIVNAPQGIEIIVE